MKNIGSLIEEIEKHANLNEGKFAEFDRKSANYKYHAFRHNKLYQAIAMLKAAACCLPSDFS